MIRTLSWSLALVGTSVFVTACSLFRSNYLSFCQPQLEGVLILDSLNAVEGFS